MRFFIAFMFKKVKSYLFPVTMFQRPVKVCMHQEAYIKTTQATEYNQPVTPLLPCCYLIESNWEIIVSPMNVIGYKLSFPLKHFADVFIRCNSRRTIHLCSLRMKPLTASAMYSTKWSTAKIKAIKLAISLELVNNMPIK